jgi:glycosyltransferase involved in cell wall biosynthesis
VRRRLRILYIAYPLLPVTPESCGGAEQVLWTLEGEMARRGHRTAVAACDGSQVSGALLSTGAAATEADRFEERNLEHVGRILGALAQVQGSGGRFDIIHDHSGSFWRHARQVDLPVLATLHLPRAFYPEDFFQGVPPNLYFNCVSESQRATFADLPHALAVVRNGIRVQDFPAPSGEHEDYLLWLGRICEEKGAHVAIDIARRAGRKLVIAGDVYPFSYHESYFEREIRPHLDNERVSYVRRPSLAVKIGLLRRANAVLLPSLVEETSSLVAMEAAACGTPVVAFRRGAIPEVVREGVTGFLVDNTEEMTGALQRVSEIDPVSCRRHVEANFSATRMGADYERLYREVLASCGGESHRTAA